ncbi:MAG: Ig-like domain-containing protein, partial [Verrucomicrobiota bacterium]|nr:Ig-like domain-containing protein [Verrucomicrobiota bacterium]
MAQVEAAREARRQVCTDEEDDDALTQLRQLQAAPNAVTAPLEALCTGDGGRGVSGGTIVNDNSRDASMVPQTPDMMVPPPAPDAMPPAPAPDAMPPAPDAMVPKEFRLEIQGEMTFTLIFDEMKAISVKYVDDQGQAITNGRVTLNNLDAQMLVSAAPGSMASTNSEGIATFTLTANEVAGSAQLTAEALNAQPVSWNITIDKRPTGKLSIQVTYSENTGRYRISDIKKARVKLIEAPCTEAFLNVAGRNEINAPMEIDPFSGSDFVDIDELPLNTVFAAVAFGLNSNGFAFVQGCTDNAQAVLNAVQTVDVQLKDQPLEFKGVFDVEHDMDLTCIIDSLGDEQFGDFERVLRLIAIMAGGEGEGNIPRTSALVEYICDIGGRELTFNVPP